MRSLARFVRIFAKFQRGLARMETEFLLQVVGAVTVLVVVAVLYYLKYAGYFYKVHVSTGRPIIPEVRVAYKFHRGNYDDSEQFFKEIYKIRPKAKVVCVYHDNPDVVDPNNCRYVIGFIIAEGLGQIPDPTLVQKLEDAGFKFTTFPEIESCVKSCHPCTVPWSVYLAGSKVYIRLIEYILENKLTAHPKLEIWDNNMIYYMVPLSKHEDFYVDEVKYILDEKK